MVYGSESSLPISCFVFSVLFAHLWGFMTERDTCIINFVAALVNAHLLMTVKSRGRLRLQRYTVSAFLCLIKYFAICASLRSSQRVLDIVVRHLLHCCLD